MQQINLDEQNVFEVINAKNENFKLCFNYNQTRQGWFVDIVSENFKLFGIRLTSLPNILEQWENRLGFGLAIKCEQNSEALFYEDFTSRRANLYLLEPEDLLAQKVLWQNLNLIDSI